MEKFTIQSLTKKNRNVRYYLSRWWIWWWWRRRQWWLKKQIWFLFILYAKMIDSGFDKINKKTWGINKHLRFSIRSSNIRHQIFLIEFISLLQSIYATKNEVIDRYTYMHCIIQNSEIHVNAQVCKYSLADLNIGQCVELTFFEGKLGGWSKNLVRN